jgi:hypothetical protein
VTSLLIMADGAILIGVLSDGVIEEKKLIRRYVWN